VESGPATPAPGEERSGQEGAAGVDDDDDPGSDAAADYAGEYELAKQHLVNFFSQDLQDNPIRARSTYVGSELSNLNYLTRQRAADQHVHHYPCSNIYVPREFRNKHTLATPNLIPKDAFVLPPRHVSDALVTEYFSHVHPMLPILDRDRFLTLYHDAEASPSILLLHAVCLAGSHVTRTYRNNNQDLKVAFFRRAKALLDGRYEEDRMNVVQAALLLTWFSDGGDDICANAWWWIGLAARTAVGLGSM
jgi:transcriptional regulatory protein AMDR